MDSNSAQSIPSSPDQIPETITNNLDLFKQRKRHRSWEQQLGPASEPTDPEIVDVASLPTVRYGSKRYVREDKLCKKGAKGKKSFIFKHGIGIIEINSEFQAMGQPLWLCRICDQLGNPRTFRSRSTTNASDHLRLEHGIVDGNPAPEAPSSTHAVHVLDLQV